MSVHTTIASNITDYGTLIAVLNESGISWQPTQAHDKVTGEPCVHAVNAVIGQEEVLIWQENSGEAFRFQSAGWTFRNKKQVQRLATAEAEAVRQRREQAERQRQEEARRRQEEERRREEMLERQRREEEARRREEERRRREEAERQRRIEEERLRVEEERRQAQLSAEASDVLARMDQSFRKPPPPASPPPVEAPAPVVPQVAPSLATAPASSQLERLIGRLHQQSARQRIKEHQEELEEKGFSLESEQLLEDETIELRFRG
jgi:hypothetical protein